MGGRVGLEEASGNRLAQGEGEGEECNRLESMLGNIWLGMRLDMLVGERTGWRRRGRRGRGATAADVTSWKTLVWFVAW